MEQRTKFVISFANVDDTYTEEVVKIIPEVWDLVKKRDHEGAKWWVEKVTDVIKAKLRKFWRCLFGLCEKCGDNKERHYMCIHCSYSHLCHRCGKVLNYVRRFSG